MLSVYNLNSVNKEKLVFPLPNIIGVFNIKGSVTRRPLYKVKKAYVPVFEAVNESPLVDSWSPHIFHLEEQTPSMWHQLIGQC